MSIAICPSAASIWNEPERYIGRDSNQTDEVVGAGDGLSISLIACYEAYKDQFRTARSVVVPIEEKFERLAMQWKRETWFLSSPEDIAMNSAYQRIIGMGSKVVPLLLGELARKPDHWFWALRAITGENPVDPDDAGYVSKMAKAWVDWGRASGIKF